MFTETEKNKAQFLAFQETIANHTVGILTNSGLGVGTGTMIRYGSVRVFLTANHVIEGNAPSTVRIAFRPGGTLRAVKPRDFGNAPAPLLAGEQIEWRPVTDTTNDIAALVVARELEPPAPCAFYDVTNLKHFQIEEGASLFFLGFPVANSIDIGPLQKAVGAVSDHARYDSTMNDLPGLPSSYDPDQQFLIRYGWGDEIEPYGLSGSSVWCSRHSDSNIWTANPVLVGVVTHYLPKSKLLIVANLRPILALLASAAESST
jgi:hypothetical protein